MTDISYTVTWTPTSSTDTGTSDSHYDALNPRGRRRRAPITTVQPEDWLLNQNRRDRLDTNALDVWRNFGLLSWMIRRTLDYCCLWDFQPQTTDDGLNREWRQLMERDSEPQNLDYVGRMDWDSTRRVCECLKILTGDCFLIPLREHRLQAIEGSYCRNPRNFEHNTRWRNGAKLNRRGRVVAWNFRQRSLLEPPAEPRDRDVAARNVWQHVQYEGRLDQIRGYAPVAAILNECRDIDETFNHARAKVKLDQLFALAVFRHPGDEDEIARTVDDAGNEDTDATDDTGEEKYDFGGPGPVVMDRDVGEDVKFLQSSNPAGSTQDFLKLCMQLALLGLDLPFNFLDASHTNFFGSRAAWNLYERACHARRRSQLWLHHRYTRWRRLRYVLPESLGGSGELVLPRGMDIDDLRYTWVPRGIPWWKPAEELKTNLEAAAAGLKSMQQICDEHGLGLFEENVKALAREQAEVQRHGYVLEFNPSKLLVALQRLDNAEGAAA